MVAVLAHAVATEHQLLHQLHTGSNPGIVKDDRVVDHGSFTDVAAGADHRWANNRGTVFDLGHASHVDRTAHVDLVPVGGHVQTGEDTWLNLLTGNAHLTHVPQQNAADGLPVIGHLTDVHPLEIHRNGIEGCPELRQFREQVRADVEGHARRDVIENSRLEDVNAGVDRVTQGFFHLGFFLEVGDPVFSVCDHDAVAAHLVLGDALGDKAGQGTFLPVATNRFGEVEIDQSVTAEHHEGVVEEVLEILNFLQSAS